MKMALLLGAALLAPLAQAAALTPVTAPLDQEQKVSLRVAFEISSMTLPILLAKHQGDTLEKQLGSLKQGVPASAYPFVADMAKALYARNVGLGQMLPAYLGTYQELLQEQGLVLPQPALVECPLRGLAALQIQLGLKQSMGIEQIQAAVTRVYGDTLDNYNGGLPGFVQFVEARKGESQLANQMIVACTEASLGGKP